MSVFKDNKNSLLSSMVIKAKNNHHNDCAKVGQVFNNNYQAYGYQASTSKTQKAKNDVSPKTNQLDNATK